MKPFEFFRKKVLFKNMHLFLPERIVSFERNFFSLLWAYTGTFFLNK